LRGLGGHAATDSQIEHALQFEPRLAEGGDVLQLDGPPQLTLELSTSMPSSASRSMVACIERPSADQSMGVGS
jgi:hypothetical protein